MSTTIRKQIIDALATRLATIRKSAGYNTEMGANVIAAMSGLSGQDLPAIVYEPGVEDCTHQYNKHVLIMPVVIYAVVPVTTNAINDSESALADVIKCVCGSDRTLGGLCQSIKYLQGGVSGFADNAQSVSVMTSFEIYYMTDHGDPYNDN